MPFAWRTCSPTETLKWEPWDWPGLVTLRTLVVCVRKME